MGSKTTSPSARTIRLGDYFLLRDFVTFRVGEAIVFLLSSFEKEDNYWFIGGYGFRNTGSIVHRVGPVYHTLL